MMFRLAYHTLFSNIALITATLVCVSPSLMAQELTATLAFVKGEVIVENRAAENGEVLRENQVVRTKKGSVTLLIGEETVIHLGEDSEFELNRVEMSSQRDERIDANLKYGKVRALVGSDEGNSKELEIRTRSSVMGVRGTHIYMNSPPDPNMPVQYVTLQGTAEVRIERRPPPGRSQGQAGQQAGSGGQGSQGSQAPTQDSGQRSGATQGGEGSGAPAPEQAAPPAETQTVTLTENQSLESSAGPADGPEPPPVNVQTVSGDQVERIQRDVGGDVGSKERLVATAPEPTRAPAPTTETDRSPDPTESSPSAEPTDSTAPAPPPPPPPSDFFDGGGFEFDGGDDGRSGFDDGPAGTFEDNPFDEVDNIEKDLTGGTDVKTENELDPTTDSAPPPVPVEIDIQL